jgi:histidine triad (HIT) family protein
MDDCIFCKIARGELPVKVLASNEHAIAFPDLRPVAPSHALVIPRAHLQSLNEVTDFAVLGAMHALAVQVAREAGLAQSGYRTVINSGPDAGQTVFHLHLHVLGGRPMQWPPG